MNQQNERYLQQRYQGFLNTPPLWVDSDVEDLEQFSLPLEPQKITTVVEEKLRLGKYIEKFVLFNLQQDTSITNIHSNIQIQKEKLTLGEIDCLFVKNNIPIHLEVSYKFYILDSSRGKNEIEHCIGPNNRDSLVEKLHRIKSHQLPLLHKDETKIYLDKLKFKTNNCQQKVLFKCQLFIPINHPPIDLEFLNPHCISGFYSGRKEFCQFSECKFYIPNKKDWLVLPHTDVKWIGFEKVNGEIDSYHKKKYSPMIWMKNPNGEISKVFVLWWK